MNKLSRRELIRRMGVASLIPVVPIAAEAATRPGTAPPAPVAGTPGQSGSAPPKNQYVFLRPQEVAFLDAACEQLIPADETGPGARDANVVNYFDKQLGGAWGAGERLYRSGPWQEGAPTQGYQLPFTPAEFFRHALRAIEAEFQQRGTPFHKLGSDEQVAWLKSLESGEHPALGKIPAKTFFEHLWELTQEGYFADPVYGGNHDMVAWRMIGFPGAYADFYNLVDQYGLHYEGEPVSLGEDPRGRIHVQPDIKANVKGEGRA